MIKFFVLLFVPPTTLISMNFKISFVIIIMIFLAAQLLLLIPLPILKLFFLLANLKANVIAVAAMGIMVPSVVRILHLDITISTTIKQLLINNKTFTQININITVPVFVLILINALTILNINNKIRITLPRLLILRHHFVIILNVVLALMEIALGVVAMAIKKNSASARNSVILALLNVLI